mmetsp:Transcript_9471/g.13856  ORF Transcript_9471/g.13856 Transcript_9471/m.13856 type:complete len:159 (-) Transcript_9471:263-739(-)|eukprot:CAMPEP_0175094732 /NCGR_PEP_ID=MMETSP0086_2-20121207/3759_1 /TAXON_ID=136419 /ORGANISM="Unknown Unknown, Strain D1" /LENGTH=158 /DNA_ID=CAMNT_0016367893 /DNA_START=44 /DNA_END=520 /DNA_ORIENTATION=-
MTSVIVNMGEEDFSDEEMEQKTATKRKGVKTKGRGFKGGFNDDRYSGQAGQFEALDEDEINTDAQRSVEGYIVFVTNVHEEAQEDDIHDLFADYGEPKQIDLNLDRRTGYVKGYALIEFATYKEANNAITNLNGHSLLEQEISVDWAFVKPKKGKGRR